MNVLYFGSPQYSVATLQELTQSRHKVVGVFTQPDRKSGRGNKINETPVKEFAKKHDIPVYTPESLKTEEAFQLLQSIDFDLGVVVAYGLILPTRILDLPKYGFINAHGSILPKYRGASPIAAPILNGDKTTGVTIQKMVLKVDAGDILLQESIAIERTDTAETLHDKLSLLSAKLCLQACEKIENGTATYTPQNEAEASLVKKLAKEMGEINWNETAETIENKIKAYHPWPGTYTFLKSNENLIRVKIIKAYAEAGSGASGVVIDNSPLHFTIGTASGLLRVFEMQREGKSSQDTATFLNGNPIKKGTQLFNSNEKK